jgi:hypothetical protein
MGSLDCGCELWLWLTSSQGGDEVAFNCWESNPQIQAWMAAHPEIENYAQLEAYYELNLCVHREPFPQSHCTQADYS